MATLYTVKPGESLSIIARNILDDIEQWPMIAYMNELSPPYLIYPGQVLRVPNGEPLTVVIDKWPNKPPNGGATAAPANKIDPVLTPATLIILGVAVVFLLRQ